MADEPTIEEKVYTRDDLRSRVFATKQVKTKEIDFFGAKLELRQPSIAQALLPRDGDEPKIAIIHTLIDCAYVPRTLTKVFTAEDYDSLAELPFDADFVRATQAISELTGTNLQVTADSSNKGQ